MKQSATTQFKKTMAACCAWWQSNGLLLAAVFAIGAAVHFLIWSNGLQNPDSLWLGSDYHIASEWELSLGRWALVLVDILRGGINSPVISGLGMLFFYALGGVLLADVLDLRALPLRALASLSIVLAPATATTETFIFCSTAYALAFFLAVLSVRCVQCLPGFWGSAVGAACLTFALGIYQSNIGVATGLSVFLLLCRILRTPRELKATGNLAARLAVMGLGGVAAYYAILQVVLKWNHVQMAEYKGANSIGVLSVFRSLGQTVPSAYRDFFAYFFGRDIVTNAYTARPVYVVLLCLALALLALRLWQVRSTPLACACAAVLILLIPAGTAFIDIITAQTTIIALTANGLLTVVPFCLALAGNIALPPQKARVGTVLVALLVALLLRSYIIQINTDGMLMLNSKQMTLNLANRVVAQLEQNEDYLAGLPLMIVGQPELGNYKNQDYYYPMTDPMPQAGLFFGSPPAAAAAWQNLLRQYLGVNPNYCTTEQVLAVSRTEEYQEMPDYPAEGSIRTIDGCVVVRIARAQ